VRVCVLTDRLQMTLLVSIDLWAYLSKQTSLVQTYVLNSPQCHNNIPSNQIKMIYEFTYSLIEHVNSHVWHANTPKTTSNAGKTMMHYPFL